MDENMKVDEELLEEAAGGTVRENERLVTALMATTGNPDFLKADGTIDFEVLKEYFAERGYTFVPGIDTPNVFIGPDKEIHNQKYILSLLSHRKL